MSWSTKTKTEQQGNDEDILTPDGFQILVGSSEDQVLVYQTGFNNWDLKSKNVAGSWGLKAKITP